MGWIFATIIMAMDSAIGMARFNWKQAEIQRKARDLAKQISADRELVNKLYTAYVQKDAKLANSLLGASPFSTYYRNTINAAKGIDAKMKEASDEIERINRAEIDMTNDITAESAKHQTSGSVIIDLITGTAQKPVNTMSYEKSKFNQETNQNVQK